MKERHPFKHFDLPTFHLSDDNHYVPPRAIDDDEIERRRSLPRGTLLLEQQRDGLVVARRWLEQLDDEPEARVAGSILAQAAFNSSWYLFARDDQSERMRKRLSLATPLDPETDVLRSPEAVRRATLDRLANAAVLAERLRLAHETGQGTERLRTESGRIIGSLGTSLALLGSEPEQYRGMNPFEISKVARQHSLIQLNAARRPLGRTHPSGAQLSDPYSEITTMVRTTASPNVARALRRAQLETKEEETHYAA